MSIFKKINLATVLRMNHGKKLGSRKGSLDILVAAGKSSWQFEYPTWDLFRRRNRETGLCLGKK